MALTAAQLLERRSGITGTDAPKIVGVSPFGSAIDVLLSKQGVAPPFVETDRVKWGNILEDPIRRDFADRHGYHVTTPGTLRVPRNDNHLDWMMATPDGILWTQGLAVAGHEIKTHTVWVADHYGEPGTDEVPPDKLIQSAWNLAVARRVYGEQIDRWYLTPFIDGLPRDYVIHHDPELERDLIEVCGEFWRVHVVEGKPLEPDGSDAYGEHLARKFPRDSGDYLTATDEAFALIQQLRHMRGGRKVAEATEAVLVQKLKAEIGDHSGIEWVSETDEKGREKKSRISWKRSRDSERTDWKAAFRDLRSRVELMAAAPKGHRKLARELVEKIDQTITDNTTTKPGSRRFTVPRSWDK